MHRSLSIAFGLLIFVGTAWAQEPPSDAEVASETRFWEALRAGKWRDALGAYNDLETPPKKLAYPAAQAYANLGELDLAATTLSAILAGEPSHLGAVYLLARVRARQGRLDDARTLLCTSARLGQSVLRDLAAEEDEKLFAPLLKDPDFIVTVMREAGSWQAEGPVARDPFERPTEATPGKGGAKVDRGVLRRIAALEARLQALLSEFRGIGSQEDVAFSDLELRLGEFRQALGELEGLEHPSARTAAKRYRTELGELRGLLRPLQLKLFVADGNHHLRVMAEALRGEKYEQVQRRFGLLQDLCDAMRAQPEEAFRANAAQLLLRGDQLSRRARTLQIVASFRLQVTGIVCQEDDTNSAIVNDRIYGPGDSIIDAATEKPVPGLTVERIAPSTVTFKYQDVSFVRELVQPR